MIVLEKLLPELKKRTLSPKQLRHKHFRLGMLGEERAIRYLQQKGYSIIGTNLVLKHLEVDIVALHPDFNSLIFIEVKTKYSNSFGDAHLAYTYKKKTNCHTLGAIIAHKLKWHIQIQFDLICIVLHPFKLDHYTHTSW